MFFKYIIKILIITLLMSCSGKVEQKLQKEFKSPESLYVTGILKFDEQKFNEADNFSIKGKWGLEHKIKSFNSKGSITDILYDLTSTQNVSYTSEFREFYFSIIKMSSELRIGKQIHAWGSVDANSPFDFLNPIDYYYLFTDSDETKIGKFSLLLDLY